MRKKLHYIRFKCPVCGYLSPGGYTVNAANCPECKSSMTRGLYRQYETRCKLVKTL
jgi:predicted Zn-ribbon and HTH transcriptional regulator